MNDYDSIADGATRSPLNDWNNRRLSGAVLDDLDLPVELDQEALFIYERARQSLSETLYEEES